MKNLHIFLFEGKHFVRNPFKIVALILFFAAGIYGLHNGASLYKKQQSVIEEINKKVEKDRQDVIDYYEEGKVGPKSRPWVDVTTPFWSMWYTNLYHFKTPSPAMVYSTGQAEQYGFYKKITFTSSVFDADMSQEIANPERLQIGALDFSFVILFLLPLVLLILIYNIKSQENEQGFLPLVLIQNSSENSWLISRMLFYVGLVLITLVLLLIYGAILTNVFTSDNQIFIQVFLLSLFYLLFWSAFYFIVLKKGKSILSNTLLMVGVYLLFAFIIPATVHQWVSVKIPVNLMTGLIDVKRDKTEGLYEEPDSVIQAKLNTLFPEISNTPVAKDSLRSTRAMNSSISALVNELMKENSKTIQNESKKKNQIVKSTYWFNPVTFFQNQFNKQTKTHYRDYQQYRDEIQASIEKQLKIMVPDIYSDTKVDKTKYLDYINQLSYDE